MSRSGISGLVVALLAGVVLMSAARVEAQRRPPPGGVVWEVKVLDDKDEVVDKGTFRAVDNKIFHEGKQIGTYKDLAKDHSTVSIITIPTAAARTQTGVPGRRKSVKMLLK